MGKWDGQFKVILHCILLQIIAYSGKDSGVLLLHVVKGTYKPLLPVSCCSIGCLVFNEIFVRIIKSKNFVHASAKSLLILFHQFRCSHWSQCMVSSYKCPPIMGCLGTQEKIRKIIVSKMDSKKCTQGNFFWHFFMCFHTQRSHISTSEEDY